MNMTSNQDKIAAAWRIAAQDLGLALISPFTLCLKNGVEYGFIAWIGYFGSERGTLICLPEQWDKQGFSAAAQEACYYCSGLYPDSYAHYDREHFIDTLRDWGWFGDASDMPSWLDILPEHICPTK